MTDVIRHPGFWTKIRGVKTEGTPTWLPRKPWSFEFHTGLMGQKSGRETRNQLILGTGSLSHYLLLVFIHSRCFFWVLKHQQYHVSVSNIVSNMVIIFQLFTTGFWTIINSCIHVFSGIPASQRTEKNGTKWTYLKRYIWVLNQK